VQSGDAEQRACHPVHTTNACGALGKLSVPLFVFSPTSAKHIGEKLSAIKVMHVIANN
jgi:hypothetical protein